MNGIKALNMSSNMIERMSEELIAMEPQLEHKAKVSALEYPLTKWPRQAEVHSDHSDHLVHSSLNSSSQLTDELMKRLGEEKVTVDNTKQIVSREEAAVNRENVRIGNLLFNPRKNTF